MNFVHESYNSNTFFFRFCGATLPPDLISSGPHMTVVFVADDGVADSGFNASYQAVSILDSEFLVMPSSLIFPSHVSSLFFCHWRFFIWHLFVFLFQNTLHLLKRHVVQDSLPAVQGNVFSLSGYVMDGTTAPMEQMNRVVATPPSLLLVSLYMIHCSNFKVLSKS